jgi:hypothetical protein
MLRRPDDVDSFEMSAVSAHWRFQWSLVVMALCLLDRTPDEELFGTAARDAAGYWNMSRDIPNLGRKLARLMRRAQRRGLPSFEVRGPHPSTGWSAAFDPPARATDVGNRPI